MLVDALVTVKQFGYKLVDNRGCRDPRHSHEDRFRTKVFARAFAAAALSLLALAGLMAWQRPRATARRHRAPPDRRGAPHRRPALAGNPTLDDRRRARSTRPIDSASDRQRASRSSPRTAASSATRRRPRPSCRTLENHLHAARSASPHASTGSGSVQRYSTTVSTDMLYVAVPCDAPDRRVRPPGAAADRRRRAACGASRARRLARWPRRFRSRCSCAWLFVCAR